MALLRKIIFKCFIPLDLLFYSYSTFIFSFCKGNEERTSGEGEGSKRKTDGNISGRLITNIVFVVIMLTFDGDAYEKEQLEQCISGYSYIFSTKETTPMKRPER